jgi:hypothetical protein
MTGDVEQRIHITRVKKAGLALLSKKISLGDNGRPVSDGSPCAMSSGTATRVGLDWRAPATDLAALISDLGPHEALVLGDHVAEPDAIEIVKAAYADPPRHYGRTLDTFKFKGGSPTAALLKHRPVTMIGIEQLARLTLALLQTNRLDIDFTLTKVKENVSFVAKMVLLLSDSPLASVHSQILSTYYSGTTYEALKSWLAKLCKVVGSAAHDDEHAQSVTRNYMTGGKISTDRKKNCCFLPSKNALISPST